MLFARDVTLNSNPEGKEWKKAALGGITFQVAKGSAEWAIEWVSNIHSSIFSLLPSTAYWWMMWLYRYAVSSLYMNYYACWTLESELHHLRKMKGKRSYFGWDGFFLVLELWLSVTRACEMDKVRYHSIMPSFLVKSNWLMDSKKIECKSCFGWDGFFLSSRVVVGRGFMDERALPGYYAIFFSQMQLVSGFLFWQ